MGTIFVSEMLNTFEETFEVTEMRTIKHEPFLIVGERGGSLFVVLYGYSTIEREALAAVAAIKEFFPYLYGRQFMLLTDHTNVRLKDTGGRPGLHVGFCTFNNLTCLPGTDLDKKTMLMQMDCLEDHPQMKC